jgi:methyltransferase (TIGR00027 family)
MKGPLLDKLQSKLKEPVIQGDARDAVARLARVRAKPDKYAILTAQYTAVVLIDTKFRHLMPANTLPVLWGYLQKVMPVEAFKKKISKPSVRDNFYRWENKTFPGLATHFVLRKRKIEEEVRKQLEAGIKQVVNLGAGYDTLCTRLSAEYPDVEFFELDLPSTQKPKTDTLKSRPRNLHFINLDFLEPHLEKIMKAHPKYDRHKRTYFIAESLFHFLDDDSVDRIFTFMADHSGHRSHLAFTFLDRGLDGRPTYPDVSILADIIMKLNRVEFEFGLKMDSLMRFLNDRYFGLTNVYTAQELRDEAPTPIPPCPKRVKSEYLAFGELVFEG